MLASRKDGIRSMRCAFQEDLPMASVMKQKPTMEPRYPTSGRIHMVCLVSSSFLDSTWAAL